MKQFPSVLGGIAFLVLIVYVLGSIGLSKQANLGTNHPTTHAEAVSETRRLPHYITPTSPVMVVDPTVGCFNFEDHVTEVSSHFGMPVDVDHMIDSGRCVKLTNAMHVEVVERPKFPNGKDMNSVCVKPTGNPGRGCVWALIQKLAVVAD